MESFYDSDYSLSKMDPPCYILDPRWETIGCSFKEDNKPAFFVDGPDVGKAFAQYDPAKTTTYAFNALFDNCIASWRYKFVPAQMLCTCRLSVATKGHLLKKGASLGQVAKLLKVGEKGDVIKQACGKRYSDLRNDPPLWRLYKEYANNDNELNAAILATLYKELPTAERKVMDQVLRCAVEPRFCIDVGMLHNHLRDLDTQKAQMLVDAGAQPGQEEEFARELRSSAKFVEVLEKHGVDVEYKHSLTNPEIKIPAFAKVDDFMHNLEEHPDPAVQALVAARLGLRSTIEQTRGERILRIANLDWSCYHGGNEGVFPIPLKYSGAHTHRFSGDWKLNAQNLPAGRGNNKSKLRLALKAPPGYKVVVADKSQIECRINAYICGQQDLLQVFRDKLDPYARLAASIFMRDVSKGSVERFIGKTGVLGLGFGCGHAKFYNMVVRSARLLGLDITTINWTPELADTAVRVYRRQNGHISAAWRRLQEILETAWLGGYGEVQWGPVVISHGCVEAPNGLKMHYGNPRREYNPIFDGEVILYDYDKRTFRMYGPKMLENIVQFLARTNTMNDALRIRDRTGYSFASQSHDELVWLVPEDKAEAQLAIALEEMRRPPSWAPDIPLDAEGGIGDSYGEAK